MHSNSEHAQDAQVRQALGKAIAARRKALAMSQAEAAVMMGFTQGALSRIEAGKAPATVTLLMRVAPILHTSPWLLVAQAVGTQQERAMAEHLTGLMQMRPGSWDLLTTLLMPGSGRETLP